MAITDKEVQAPQQTQQVQQSTEQVTPTTEKTFIEAGAYKPDIYAGVPSEQSNVQFVVRKLRTVKYDPMRGVWSGLVTLVALSLMVGLLFLGIGFSMGHNSDSSTASAGGSSSGMSSSGGAATDIQNANVPNATQSYGNQILPYTIDKDGAKHFTMTAEQVMWDVVGGHRVLAWTINGTMPGPMIRVTSGDHVRITFINHFPEATAVHWHGLSVPMNEDGVPGVGQNVIQPGQTYVYDFTVHDQDVGTHWYHSHYDDITQVTDGFFGAFIVDPRPGTALYQQTPHADVEYTEFLSEMDGYYLINGKSYPDTQPIKVKHGQTVLIRMIGADTMAMHPMHMHGGYFNIVAEDGHPLTQPITKDTVQVAPGETYDLVFQANAAPGSIYPFHCHILSHLMNPDQTSGEMGGLITLVEYAKQ